MKSLLKRLTASMLTFVLLLTMVLGGSMAVFADETVAGEDAATEETTEKETVSIESRTYRRLFVAGDSTVCNWDTFGNDYREPGINDPQSGWVEMLSFYIKDSKLLQIQDGANAGYSAKTYYDGSATMFNNTNQLTTLLGTAGGGQNGDFLLIQFGQSDSKAPNDSMSEQDKKYAEENYTDVATYKDYLKLYIADARAIGVIPILVTPIADWNVDEAGNFVSSYAEYAQAVRDVAAEEETLLIDMDQKSREFYATLDEEELKRIFLFCEEGEYNTNHSAGAADTENFQIYGAMHMARLIAEGLVETGDQWLIDNIYNTDLPTAKPAAPAVTVLQNKEKVFNIQWEGTGTTQVYFVYQMIDGEWTLVKQTEGTNFNVMGAIDEANCEYKVVAMNSYGYSEDSNVVKRELVSEESAEETTTVAKEKEGGNILPIIIAAAVVLVIVIVVVVIIVIKKRNSDDDEYYEEDDDEEYEEDDDDEYEDDDDEYEDDEDDDEYEDEDDEEE